MPIARSIYAAGRGNAWTPTAVALAAAAGAAASAAATLSVDGGEVDDAPTTYQKYVRAGASGSGSGDDWTNAYTALPATLVRDTTYWVADGSYAAYTFDDALDGTKVIRVKKASAGLHGTDTGWSSGYGDGQADFGTMTFTRGRYIIDGSYRNEADWFDGAAYGFKVGTANSEKQFIFTFSGVSPSNISVGYTYSVGYSVSVPGIGAYSIDTYQSFEGTCTGLRFHHQYVEGGNNIWFLRNTSGAIVEYCANDGAWSNANNHGEIVNLYFDADDCTVRFCIFKDAYIGNNGTALIAWNQGTGLKVYGNLFWNFECGDGVVGFDGGTGSNAVFAYNTIVDGPTSNSSIFSSSGGSGNVVRNNLWINCNNPGASAGSGSTVTHNGYSQGSGSGSNTQVSIATSIFVNYAAGDFRLASNTTAGVALGSPYDDTDLAGNARTSPSRGAYEYV